MLLRLKICDIFCGAFQRRNGHFQRNGHSYWAFASLHPLLSLTLFEWLVILVGPIHASVNHSADNADVLLEESPSSSSSNGMAWPLMSSSDG